MSEFNQQFGERETTECETEAKRASLGERKPNDLDIVDYLKAKTAQKDIASEALKDTMSRMAVPRHNIPLGKFACVSRFKDEFDVEY
ncbi:MAG: hypothetical protein FWC26_02480, partial [Fibromonadales bacterium]|nr:hypothetical protein [Fibromonadales bacterium]